MILKLRGFADEAKTIATRGSPVDIGFTGGILSEDPSLSFFVKNRNTYFISTELEFGSSRGLKGRNDFVSVNVLAHPFNDLEYRPHFLLGVGQMYSKLQVNNALLRENNMYVKAGLGISKSLGGRLRFRADLSQYAVETDVQQLNHFSQISLGTSFIWGSSTDPILNRSIGEKVGISDLELTLFSGSVVLNHAETVSNTGLRLSYHVSEDYFFEGHASSGSKDYQHMGIAIGRNLLSSEYILKWRDKRNFWPTQLYAIAGTGIQHIDQDEQVSVSIGAGFRINPTRQWAIRIDGRQHIVHQQIFNNTVLGKYLKNPELSFGASYFF